MCAGWDVANRAVRVSSRGRFAVLLYTLAVEDVVALGLDCVLGDVIAEPADSRFHHISRKVQVGLALEDKIGVACLRPI